MDRHLHRNRSTLLVIGLVSAQLLLLGYQVRRPDAAPIRMVRYGSAALILPVERGTSWVVDHVRGVVSGYIALHGVRQENQQLRQQMVSLELRNQQLAEAARELPGLDALLGFQRQYGIRTLAAQVISGGASADSQAIYINRGAHYGLKRNMAVITPDGIVGKLTQVYDSSAQVLLVTDSESGVGVLIGAQGVHGILRGLDAGHAAIGDVLKGEPTPVGTAVITSGEDQVFPKGLAVGTVTGEHPSGDGVFKTVQIRLAADPGRLEQVLVITGKLPPPPAEAQGLTAADVRQAQLPSLPSPTAADPPAAAPAATVKTVPAGAQPATHPQ